MPAGTPGSPVPSAEAAAPPAVAAGRPSSLRIDAFWDSDAGRARDHNEDAISGTPSEYDKAATRGHLFIVADGMGGHNAGEVASNEAIKRVYGRFYADSDPDLYRSLERAVRMTNNELFQQAQATPAQHGMGTTMTAAVIHDGRLIVAHVGDSRLYLVRGGKLEQVTHDHSWVEEQVRAGVLTRLQAESHPQRNVITRALATGPDVRVDREERDLQPGDVLVFCSDGLNTEVGDAQIAAHATKASSAAEAVQRLIQLANDNGGEDNISVGVIRVFDGAVAVPGAAAMPVGKRRRRAIIAAAAAVVALAVGGGALFALSGLWQPERTPAVAISPTTRATVAATSTSSTGTGNVPGAPAAQTATPSPVNASMPAPAVNTTPGAPTSTPAPTFTQMPTPARGVRTATPGSAGTSPTAQSRQQRLVSPPIPLTPGPGANENSEMIKFAWAPGPHPLGATEAYAVLLWPEKEQWANASGLDLPTPFNACDEKLTKTEREIEGSLLGGDPWNSYRRYAWTVVIIDWDKKDPARPGKCQVVSEQGAANRFNYTPPGPSCGGSKSGECAGRWECKNGNWECVR
jgi:serine/threonine protein phosphatase PrpC